MAHPTENALKNSTSPRRQIFWLNNHRMNDPTATIAAPTTLHHSDRDYVNLLSSPTPSLSHEILPSLPVGHASTLLASTSTSEASASSPRPFGSASEASSSAPRPYASHTLASPGSAQLLAASASTSPSPMLSLWYQLCLSAMYSLPLATNH